MSNWLSLRVEALRHGPRLRARILRFARDDEVGLLPPTIGRMGGAGDDTVLPSGSDVAPMSNAQTYCGLWSAEGIRQVSNLLRKLGVTFEVNEYETTEDILREWCAWDAGAANPYVGFDLWIRSVDLPVVGSHIVEAFPERKFGAP